MTVTSANCLRLLRGLLNRGPAEHAAEHRAWLAFWAIVSTLLVTCSPLQFDRLVRQPRGAAHRLSAVSPRHSDAGSEDLAHDIPASSAPAHTSLEPGTADDDATWAGPVDRRHFIADVRLGPAVPDASAAIAGPAALRPPGRAPPQS